MKYVQERERERVPGPRWLQVGGLAASKLADSISKFALRLNPLKLIIIRHAVPTESHARGTLTYDARVDRITDKDDKFEVEHGVTLACGKGGASPLGLF